MAIMKGKLELWLGFGLRIGLGGDECFLLLLCYFCLFVYLLFLFSYVFAYRQVRKVLTGVLAQVQARSPGSSPGFDVILSRFVEDVSR